MSNAQRKRNKRKNNIESRKRTYENSGAYYAKHRAEQKAIFWSHVRAGLV